MLFSSCCQPPFDQNFGAHEISLRRGFALGVSEKQKHESGWKRPWLWFNLPAAQTPRKSMCTEAIPALFTKGIQDMHKGLIYRSLRDHVRKRPHRCCKPAHAVHSVHISRACAARTEIEQRNGMPSAKLAPRAAAKDAMLAPWHAAPCDTSRSRTSFSYGVFGQHKADRRREPQGVGPNRWAAERHHHPSATQCSLMREQTSLSANCYKQRICNPHQTIL